MKHGDFFVTQEPVLVSPANGHVFPAGTRVQLVTLLDKDDMGRDALVRTAPEMDHHEHMYAVVDRHILKKLTSKHFEVGKIYKMKNDSSRYRYEIIDVRAHHAAAWIWAGGRVLTATILPVGRFEDYEEANVR